RLTCRARTTDHEPGADPLGGVMAILRAQKYRSREQLRSRLRRKLRAYRPCFERLEERVLLDAGQGLPPAIVVGRTLSAYNTGAIQNDQIAITYTVYNEQANPVSGVLLTDTLQPGVTFRDASQLPDRNGQDLAWSLGTIAGFDRATVTLNVSLTNPTPL